MATGGTAGQGTAVADQGLGQRGTLLRSASRRSRKYPVAGLAAAWSSGSLRPCWHPAVRSQPAARLRRGIEEARQRVLTVARQTCERSGIVTQIVGQARRLRAGTTLPSLSVIAQWSDDAMFSMTDRGVIQAWNRAAERLLGYSRAEIAGRPVSVLVPPGLCD